MPTLTTRRKFGALALSAVLTASLSGCFASDTDAAAGPESGFDAIQTAAKGEGTITWYTSIPEAVSTAAAKDFTEQHGIQVETIILTSGLLTTRYSTELSSGSSPADVVTVADPLFFADALSKQWIAEFTKGDTPALDAWPADYTKQNAYALVNIQPIGVSVDTTKVDVDKLKASWEHLLDPAFRGQMYLVNPTNVPNWLAHMNLLRSTYGDDFLKRLGEQQPKLVDSSVPGTQQVAAGAGALVYPGLFSVSKPLSDKGATLDTVFPSPTSGVEQYAAISKGAPHPNAARLFLDYLLTERAQKIINKGTGSSPLGPLEGTLPLPEGYVTPDIAAALQVKDEILGLMSLN
ncbi:ABC transporter substrate-binding protein [Actinokineospora pegani]|uniref:ABC transporter substrate-binding protein n=1 Tax=Actinokineospora pegani TaxID=2654637 RepID=UPI0012EA8637|nr:extracellular solute-binding protein [Actinokineospora pegani]